MKTTLLGFILLFALGCSDDSSTPKESSTPTVQSEIASPAIEQKEKIPPAVPMI